jgi:hypothetical protein
MSSQVQSTSSQAQGTGRQKKSVPITPQQKQALWALFRSSNYAHDALPRPGHDAPLDALAAKLQLTYTQCARQYGIYRRSRRDDVCHTLSPAAHARRAFGVSGTLRNRLRSIARDAAFVRKLASKVPLPVVANARAGCWYAHTKHVARFKSTDGHRGQWALSLRRLNLDFLRIVVAHDGALLVDATRRGRSLPDALSKTVPIWCCCVNRAAGFVSEELRLPPCVADAEATAIKARLDAYVLLMRQHAPDLRLAKPLRCLWVVNGDDTSIALPEDATPIICVSASAPNGDLQGAADDEEAWAPPGFTADVFWRNPQILEEASDDAVEAAVAAAAAAAPATPCEEAEPYDYVVLMRRPFFCDRRGRLRSLHAPSTHASRGDDRCRASNSTRESTPPPRRRRDSHAGAGPRRRLAAGRAAAGVLGRLRRRRERDAGRVRGHGRRRALPPGARGRGQA